MKLDVRGTHGVGGNVSRAVEGVAFADELSEVHEGQPNHRRSAHDEQLGTVVLDVFLDMSEGLHAVEG